MWSVDQWNLAFVDSKSLSLLRYSPASSPRVMEAQCLSFLNRKLVSKWLTTKCAKWCLGSGGEGTVAFLDAQCHILWGLHWRGKEEKNCEFLSEKWNIKLTEELAVPIKIWGQMFPLKDLLLSKTREGGLSCVPVYDLSWNWMLRLSIYHS